MLQQRIEFSIQDGQKGSTIPNGVNHELRKLYFDTVFVTTRANFAMLSRSSLRTICFSGPISSTILCLAWSAG